MAGDSLPELEQECFFIAPIGEEGTDVRDRSDGVMEYIVRPAAKELGLETIRADKIAKPGQITRQVIEHVVGAKASVVDLTGANPNVYYEMAVRHTAQLPTVLIAQDGEKLPFDIAQMRTIFFDHTNLKSAADCQSQIAQHLREALAGEVESPIAASVALQRLETGTPQERVLAQLVEATEEIRLRMTRLERPKRSTDRRAVRDLASGVAHLVSAIEAHETLESDEIKAVLREVAGPLNYLLRDDPAGREFWLRIARLEQDESGREILLTKGDPALIKEPPAPEGSDAKQAEEPAKG